MPSPTPTSINDPVDPQPFEDQLDEQERRYGPYADALTETLTGLGRARLEAGDNEGAVEALQRALHLVRINDGLRSARQLPILQQLIDTCHLTRNADCLDQAYEYYLHLQDRHDAPLTGERLKAFMDYMDWQREAYTHKVDGGARNRLLHAYMINEEALESMRSAATVNAADYRAVVLSQVRNLYLIMGDQAISGYMGPITTGERHGGHAASEEFVRQRLNYIQETATGIGRKLLQGLIDRADPLAPQVRAQLHRELGDWFWWNGYERSAAEQYRAVIGLLHDAGQPALIEQWLGSPVELPDEIDLWPSPPLEGTVVEVRFNVSAGGIAGRVEVLSTTPESAADGGKIRRLLRDSHLRPRFASGEAEAVEGVQRRYRIAP